MDINLNLRWLGGTDPAIAQGLATISQRIEAMDQQLQDRIDRITSELTDMRDATQAVQTAFARQGELLREALEAARAEGATEDQLRALDTAISGFDEAGNTLAAAAVANTAAEPGGGTDTVGGGEQPQT